MAYLIENEASWEKDLDQRRFQARRPTIAVYSRMN